MATTRWVRYYDENFVRHLASGPVETHALWVANPPNGRILPGPPQDWPDLMDWEDSFELDEFDADGLCEEDRYTNCDPYEPPRRPGPVVTGEQAMENEAVRMVREAEARRPIRIPEIRSRGEQVAVLMDFENLVLGAIASLPGREELSAGSLR